MKRMMCGLAAAFALFCCPLYAAALSEGADPLGSLRGVLTVQDSWYRSSTLGCFAADSVKDALHTQAALVPCGALGRSLSGGEVSREALRSAFPDGARYITVTVTYAQLWAIMEKSVSSVAVDNSAQLDESASSTGEFLQVSGFTMCYDVSAPIGERIMEITLDSGEASARTDETHTLTLALPQDRADRYPSCGSEAATLEEAAARYLSRLQTVTPEKAERIKVIGTISVRIIDSIPVYLIVILILASVIIRFPEYKRMREEEYAPQDSYKYGKSHRRRNGDGT